MLLSPERPKSRNLQCVDVDEKYNTETLALSATFPLIIYIYVLTTFPSNHSKQHQPLPDRIQVQPKRLPSRGASNL